VLYSGLMPVLIIVLCLLLLKACVPKVFVFNYTVTVLRVSACTVGSRRTIVNCCVCRHCNKA